MVHAARASTARATAPPSTRHPLIDGTAIRNARYSPENNALNFSNRLENACFGAHFAPHNSPLTTQNSATAISHPHSPQFLIASRQILKNELTCSQQTRKHFLIASFSRIPAPHLANHDSPIATFLFNTNKAHKIIILVRALTKTKEKQISIQYKFALGSIGNLACAP
jgi:hypothetical protein